MVIIYGARNTAVISGYFREVLEDLNILCKIVYYVDDKSGIICFTSDLHITHFAYLRKYLKVVLLLYKLHYVVQCESLSYSYQYLEYGMCSSWLVSNSVVRFSSHVTCTIVHFAIIIFITTLVTPKATVVITVTGISSGCITVRTGIEINNSCVDISNAVKPWINMMK